jgi:CRISPR-associated protein Cas5t
MSEKTILVEIFQPFAQYRNPFTFYYAQTYPLPPKSTIIGMLQNAVGDWYGSEFGIDKWWNLKVSVHGGFESVFWNYQQLIKGEVKFDEYGRLINQDLPLYGEGLKSQRSPVYQQELFNGHLYIFIKGEESHIDIIKKAIEVPSKVLYLGRSEDVIFIRNVKEVQPAERISIGGDIKLTYPTYLLQKYKDGNKERIFPIKNRKYPVYSIPTRIVFKNNGKNVRHKAEITKSTEREVQFEPVIYTGYDYSIILVENSSLDAEIYELSNNRKIKIISPFGWL